MKKVRGFESVVDAHRQHPDVIVRLPRRADLGSAGYDFVTPVTVTVKPGETKLIWTDVKAYMQQSEVLKVYSRSNHGTNLRVLLANGTGIVDASYYDNPKNDGNIGICLINNGPMAQTFSAGERIAQGIFTPYLVADDDEVLNNERIGGFGSTGQ